MRDEDNRDFADYIVEQSKKQQLQVTKVARYEDSLLKVATIGHTKKTWSYEVKYFSKDSNLPTMSPLNRYRDTHVIPKYQESEGVIRVKVGDMLETTLTRMLGNPETNIVNRLVSEGSNEISIQMKWGADGQSSQENYRNATVDDSSIYSVCLGLLKIKSTKSGEILYADPHPNSPFSCRQVVLGFMKETRERIIQEYELIEEQLQNLQDFTLEVGGRQIMVNVERSEFFSTMWDGKSTNVLSSHLSNKVIATSSCHVCFAKQGDFSSNSSRPVDPIILALGCSVLHCRIRAMEYLFNMACRKKVGHKTTEKSPEFKAQKEKLRKAFKEHPELKLDLFKVKKGAGNSNDGNSSKKFFDKAEITAKILGIEVEILTKFQFLLNELNCTDRRPDPIFFQQEADQLHTILTSEPYNQVMLTQTVHRILCHGSQFIEALPEDVFPGQVSESSIEARNKYNRRYRLYNSFAGDFSKGLKGIFHRMMLTSDPVVYFKRNMHLIW